jgi:hypothetical protein
MNPEIVKRKRELESAKKDMALLNIEYLKRKQDIEDFMNDKEFEITELEKEEKYHIEYCG